MSSPTASPSVSLTRLKKSRSMLWTATWLASPATGASASWRRVRTRPVRDDPQRVVMRHVLDPCLGAALRGHVDEGREQAGPPVEDRLARIDQHVEAPAAGRDMRRRVLGLATHRAARRPARRSVAILGRLEVAHGHGEQPVARVAVLLDRRLVDLQERQGLRVAQAQGAGVVLEQQLDPVLAQLDAGNVR